MKPWLLWAMAVLLPGGCLLVALELWRRHRVAANRPDLIERWRTLFRSGPAQGEPPIPAANVPPIVPLKAVKAARVSRFRARLAR